MNDIFEGAIDIRVDDSISEKFVDFYYDNLFSQHQSSVYRISKNDIKYDSYIEMLIRDCYASLQRSIGTACFTTKFNNLSMWGNYAEKFTGVCLEFKVNSSLFEEVKQIQYSTKPYLLNIDSEDQLTLKNLGNEIEKSAYTKHVDWRFEDEWRIVGNAGTSINYNNDTLSAIYFGNKATDHQLYKEFQNVISHLDSTNLYLVSEKVQNYQLIPIWVNENK